MQLTKTDLKIVLESLRTLSQCAPLRDDEHDLKTRIQNYLEGNRDEPNRKRKINNGA